jgi:hypothetical protein
MDVCLASFWETVRGKRRGGRQEDRMSKGWDGNERLRNDGNAVMI